MFKPKKRFKTKSEIEDPLRDLNISYEEEPSFDDMFNCMVRRYKKKNTVKGKVKTALRPHLVPLCGLVVSGAPVIAIWLFRIQYTFAIVAGIALSKYALYPLYIQIS